MTIISVAGQDIELVEGGYKLKINTIFKSAGKMYGFPNNCSGISINEDIVALALQNDKWLFITIGDSPNLYFIHPRSVMKIVKDYDSIYEKRGVRLYVVPLKNLTRVMG